MSSSRRGRRKSAGEQGRGKERKEEERERERGKKTEEEREGGEEERGRRERKEGEREDDEFVAHLVTSRDEVATSGLAAQRRRSCDEELVATLSQLTRAASRHLVRKDFQL